MWQSKRLQTTAHIQCSLAATPTIYVEEIPRQKIGLLMEAYPHQEWFAYLVGKITKQHDVCVEDISVPPHAYASGASAEAAKPSYDPNTGKYIFHSPANCVGVIHSHNTMGAFHSGTDDAYVDKNYPVSITVAKRQGSPDLEFDTVCFAVTPCGKATTGKPQVRYVQPKPLFDVADWLGKAKANIDRKALPTNREVQWLQQVAKDLEVIPCLNGQRIDRADQQELPLSKPWGKKRRPELPPRGEKGRFLPKSREGSIFTTDQAGRVLTQRELDEIQKDDR